MPNSCSTKFGPSITNQAPAATAIPFARLEISACATKPLHKSKIFIRNITMYKTTKVSRIFRTNCLFRCPSFRSVKLIPIVSKYNKPSSLIIRAALNITKKYTISLVNNSSVINHGCHEYR